MRSRIVIQKFTSGGVGLIGVDSLLDVYDATQEGDLVIVYGNKLHPFLLGDNTIQLKDGVNWKFLGIPTISGDSPNGTFSDYDNAVNVHFEGKVDVVNTYRNSVSFKLGFSSNVYGFLLTAVIFLGIEGNGEVDSVSLRESTFPSASPLTASRIGEGVIVITFPEFTLPTEAELLPFTSCIIDDSTNSYINVYVTGDVSASSATVTLRMFSSDNGYPFDIEEGSLSRFKVSFTLGTYLS